MGFFDIFKRTPAPPPGPAAAAPPSPPSKAPEPTPPANAPTRAPPEDKYATWIRDQITDRASRGDAVALAEAAVALSGRGAMIFGMVMPAQLAAREPLLEQCLEAVRALIPKLGDHQTDTLFDLVKRTGLPLDVTDRRAELAAKRQADRANRIAKITGAEPRNIELERAIAANPDDADNYSVLADWLQGQGDRRGELIALQLRAETDTDRSIEDAVAKFLDDHAGTLLGPLEPYRIMLDGSGREAFTWRRGFIDRAHLSLDSNIAESEDSLAEILELLVGHPSGRLLRELVIGINGEATDNTLDDLIAVLATHAPASLRKLHLGAFEYREQTEMSWYSVGDLAPLWAGVPQLRELIVQGGSFELGSIDLPALERAEFRTGGLSVESARAIASAQWPAIRFLEVWYGDPAYGGESTIGDVQLLLARRDLPALVHLGLQNAAHTDEFCGELGKSPLAAQLVELDLSMGTLSDVGARTLAASAAAFPRLEELDVSQNYLSRTAIALLRKAFREVVANEQNEADGDYRHPTVGE